MIITDEKYRYMLREFDLVIVKAGYAYFNPSSKKNGRYKGKPFHRAIYMLEYGVINKGFHIHHKNENKLDNRVINLELMKSGQHTSLHHKGKPLSDEHVEKLREKMTGKKHSDKIKECIKTNNIGKHNHKGANNPRFGSHCTEITKTKISEALKGFRHTDVAKRKIGLANKGKVLSDVTKLKISEAKKLYWERRKKEDGSA